MRYAHDQGRPVPGAGLIILNASVTYKEEIMDNINIIMTAISTVGFPIVMTCALFWKMNKQDDDHKEEMAKVTEALNNNTLALTRILDKIDKFEN